MNNLIADGLRLSNGASAEPARGWWFEPKWDGYRALAYVRGGVVDTEEPERENELTTRFSQGVASAIPPKALPARRMRSSTARSARLDERVGGRRSQPSSRVGVGTPIVYVVFDVLEVDGEPLVDLPLAERRKRLAKLVDRRNKTVRLSETFDDGGALLEAAKQQQLEGIVAKRRDSRYLPGKRTRDWLKVKTHGREELRHLRLDEGAGEARGTNFGSLVLVRIRRQESSTGSATSRHGFHELATSTSC